MLYSKYSSFSRLKFEGEWLRRPCSREECNTKSAPSPDDPPFPKALCALEVVGVALVAMASGARSSSLGELSPRVATPTRPHQNLS